MRPPISTQLVAARRPSPQANCFGARSIRLRRSSKGRIWQLTSSNAKSHKFAVARWRTRVFGRCHTRERPVRRDPGLLRPRPGCPTGAGDEAHTRQLNQLPNATRIRTRDFRPPTCQSKILDPQTQIEGMTLKLTAFRPIHCQGPGPSFARTLS